MITDQTVGRSTSCSAKAQLQWFGLASTLGAGLQLILSLGGWWEAQVCLFLVFFGVGGLLLANSFGLFDPRTLFFVSFGVYAASGPVDTVLYANSLGLHPERQSISLFYSTLLMVGVVLAVFNRSSTPVIVRRPNTDRSAAGAAWVFLALLAVLSVAYVIMANVVYGWSLLRPSRGLLYANKSLELDLFRFCVATAAVFALWLLQKARSGPLFYGILTAFVMLFLATDMLYLGDRKIGVGVLFGLLFLIHFGRRTPWRIYAIVGVIVVVMLIFGRVRTRPVEAWTQTIQTGFSLEWLNPATSEFGGFALLADVYIVGYTELTEMRPTYAEAFLCLIPRMLYPNRPLAPSETAAREYFPLMYRQGGARAFNAVVESMLNFWIFGPFIVGLAWGWLLTALARWSAHPIGLLMTAVLLHVVLFAARVALVSTIRTAIVVMVLTGSLYLAFRMLPTSGRTKAIPGRRTTFPGRMRDTPASGRT